MGPTGISVIFASSFFLAMLISLEVGRRVGVRRLARDPDGAQSGTGAVEGAIFALFGLLIAFTFSGAGARFDVRRQLVIQEANAIGTAYLRLDLLPDEAQPALRDSFRRYLDSRLETYRRLPDLEASKEELARSVQLQGEIWNQAVTACRAKNDPATTSLVVAALNEMIDITTTRTMSAQIHPPPLLYALLYVLGLGCALLAGHSMSSGKSRSWLHLLGFAAITAATVYVILDIEYPRMGLIRVDAIDQVLVELRASMK